MRQTVFRNNLLAGFICGKRETGLAGLAFCGLALMWRWETVQPNTQTEPATFLRQIKHLYRQIFVPMKVPLTIAVRTIV